MQGWRQKALEVFSSLSTMTTITIITWLSFLGVAPGAIIITIITTTIITTGPLSEFPAWVAS